jgi:hypothetical protein
MKAKIITQKKHIVPVLGNLDFKDKPQRFTVRITRREFLSLPLETRRRILAEQVNGMLAFEEKEVENGSKSHQSHEPAGR